MQPRRRSSVPPWERRAAYPRHPIGRARRRWPRAYDGGAPEPARVNARYRRAFDGGASEADRRRRRSFPGMDRFRRSPVRNGLIGLAIAGAAAPVAVQSYQQALRTDASHERLTTRITATDAIDDQAVMERWRTMVEAEAAPAPDAQREASIRENMERHSEYNLTRAMAEDIYDSAVEAGVDPDLAFGLVKAESSFRNTATSPVGAVGLTQLMPRTAAWMEPGTTPQKLRDQKTNLAVGFKYLNYLVDKYNGNENLALLAYNRGPGTVDRALKKGANPDNGYADFVRGKADHGHTLYSSGR